MVPERAFAGTLAFVYWGECMEAETPGYREGECVRLPDTARGSPEGRTTLAGSLRPPPGWPPTPANFLHGKLPWGGGVWRSSNSAASPGPPPPALFISPAEYLWLCPTVNLTFQLYRRPTVPCTHVISVLLRGLSFPPGAHVPPSPSCRRPPRLLRSNQSIVATCRRLPGPDPHPSAHFHLPARSHLGRGSSEHTGFAPWEGCHTVRAAPSSQLLRAQQDARHTGGRGKCAVNAQLHTVKPTHPKCAPPCDPHSGEDMEHAQLCPTFVP